MEKLNSTKPLKRICNIKSQKNEMEEVLFNISEQQELIIRLREEVEALLPNSVVTSKNFVTGYNTFKRYYSSQFSQMQYNNNCSPTMIANVLSYYNTARKAEIYSGIITQDLYDQICCDINYSSTKASNLYRMVKGLKKFCNRNEKTCIVNVYWHNSWHDITKDINQNKIIMLGFEVHAYLIVGYRIINGTRQVYTFTGWDHLPYEWVNYDSFMQMVSVDIY